MGVVLRVVILVIIGAIWHNVMTGPALVCSEEVNETSQTSIHKEVISNPTRHLLQSNDESSAPRICYPNETCGWVVYKAHDKTAHSTIMKSTCVCKDSSYDCVRRKDNLQIYAYEYKCVQNITEYDLLLPADAI